MAFYAGQHINVVRDGKKVMLSPGDACPEAAEWDHDVLQRCMKVDQVVDLEEPPNKHIKGALVKQKATNESLARASAARASTKPLSTHEAAHGKKTKTKSSTDTARAARKGAPAPEQVSVAASTAKSKKPMREIDGMQIPIRQAPKRIAPARKAG